MWWTLGLKDHKDQRCSGWCFQQRRSPFLPSGVQGEELTPELRQHLSWVSSVLELSETQYTFSFPCSGVWSFDDFDWAYGSDGKEFACNAGDLGLIPGLGRSPGGGHSNPLQYSCLENPHGQRSLVGYSPWDCTESDTTQRLSPAHTAQLNLFLLKLWKTVKGSIFLFRGFQFSSLASCCI